MKIIGKEVETNINMNKILEDIQSGIQKHNVKGTFGCMLDSDILEKAKINIDKLNTSSVEKVAEVASSVQNTPVEPIPVAVPPVQPAPEAPVTEPTVEAETPQQPTEPVAEEPKVEVQEPVVEPTPVVVSQPEPTPVVNNVVETPVATPSVPETPVAEAPAQPTVSLESAPTPVQTIEVPEPKLPEFDGREEYNLQGALAFNSSTPSLAEHQIIPEKQEDVVVANPTPQQLNNAQVNAGVQSVEATKKLVKNNSARKGFISLKVLILTVIFSASFVGLSIYVGFYLGQQ